MNVFEISRIAGMKVWFTTASTSDSTDLPRSELCRFRNQA